MKLKSLFIGLIGLGLITTSCNLDVDDSENYLSGTYTCSNLVIPADGEPFATNASYTAAFYTNSGTLTISTSDLNLGYGTFKFQTNAVPSETKLYSVDWSNSALDVTTFSGASANSDGVTIQNLGGFMSSVVNVLSTNDPINPEFGFIARIPLVISYTANHDYTVKTFMKDAIYRGTTSITTVGSQTEPFINDTIRYRVIFSQDYKKADIIFYDAKFAERMPVTIHFVLQDLDVKFTKNGYTISGTDVIPSLYDPSGLTPAPNYVFKSFDFTNTSADLTVGAAMYTVQIGNAQYNGAFQGYYVLSGNSSETTQQ